MVFIQRNGSDVRGLLQRVAYADQTVIITVRIRRPKLLRILHIEIYGHIVYYRGIIDNVLVD